MKNIQLNNRKFQSFLDWFIFIFFELGFGIESEIKINPQICYDGFSDRYLLRQAAYNFELKKRVQNEQS